MTLNSRPTASVDVAIVGAGPYGLSLAAHLGARGIEHRIFGEPMGAWKANMLPGMLLKSYPWATSLSDAASAFTIKKFCLERALPYHDELTPLPIERFLQYAEVFHARYAPHVERKLLATLQPAPAGFHARFSDGETIFARRVVVAIGLQAFRRLPQEAAQLSAEMHSHSGDYGPLDALDGQEVVVVGSGSSATDLAAMLNDRGISVSLVARASHLDFAARPRTRSLLERTIAPTSGIGQGWTAGACARYPQLIRLLPDDQRVQIANGKVWGPVGSAFARERVIGRVPLWLGRSLRKIGTQGDKVALDLTDQAGASHTLRCDHVIFATGYGIDANRLDFLDHKILSQMRLIEKSPELSSHYETSVPGLHFIGPAAANSFGPVCRFVYGAQHAAVHLTRHLSGETRRQQTTSTVQPLYSSVNP